MSMAWVNAEAWIDLNEPIGDEEVWKPVVGQEGQYEISNRGELRSWRGNGGIRKLPFIVKASSIMRGYKGYIANYSGRSVPLVIHRCVALAFLGPRPEGYCINHKNGIKVDNRVENLEYCTPKENSRHAIDIGIMAPKWGLNHSQGRLSNDQIIDIRNRFIPGQYGNRGELAKEFGVTPMYIYDIAHSRRRKDLRP